MDTYTLQDEWLLFIIITTNINVVTVSGHTIQITVCVKGPCVRLGQLWGQSSGFGTAWLLFLPCQLKLPPNTPLSESEQQQKKKKEKKENRLFALFWSWCRPACSCPVDSWQKHFGIQTLCAIQAVAIWKQLKKTAERSQKRRQRERKDPPLFIRESHLPVAETPCILHKLLLRSFSAESVLFSEKLV